MCPRRGSWAVTAVGLLERTGRGAYAPVESEIRNWPDATSLRAAVVATNAEVVAFWTRMGFIDTGERKPYRYDKLTSQSWILTKHLT